MRFAYQRPTSEGGRDRGNAKILVVTVLFAVLVAGAVATGLWSAADNQASTPAPKELAGYHLVQAVAGPEAIDEVNRLHGTDIEIVDAWIGLYEDGGEVWVSRASDEAKARELLDDMSSNIRDGDSPFRGLTRQEFQGVPVYAVTDARQVHFFYQTGAQVVWLAVPPGAEDSFLSAAFREMG
jgi:HAMP domain-containing protein